MKSSSPRFCFVCGSKLVTRYPGGDPENGAASRRCPKDHDTVDDHCAFAMQEWTLARTLTHASELLSHATMYVSPRTRVAVDAFGGKLLRLKHEAKSVEDAVDADLGAHLRSIGVD